MSSEALVKVAEGKIPIKSFKPAESNLPPLPKQKETKQTQLNLNKRLIKRKY